MPSCVTVISRRTLRPIIIGLRSRTLPYGLLLKLNVRTHTSLYSLLSVDEFERNWNVVGYVFALISAADDYNNIFCSELC